MILALQAMNGGYLLLLTILVVGAKGTFSVVLVQLSSGENPELLGPIDELPK